MRRISTPLFLFCVMWQSPALATPLYHLTDIGLLPNGNNSFAYAINDNGQVVGMSDTTGGDHAFRYSNGTMTDLGTLGGGFSQAQGINDSGVIVGYSTTSGGNADAFRYANGTMTDIGLGGGSAINNSGTIVGTAGASNQPHAFVYNGAMTILPNLPGANLSAASAINNSGQIAGYSTIAGDQFDHAVIWNGGTPTDLGTLPGDVGSEAEGINNLGQVVGMSGANGGDHAFLYSNGTMTDIGTLGFGYSYAFGINDNGWIVGRADTVNGFSNNSRAFLDISGTMYNLNSLMDSSRDRGA